VRSAKCSNVGQGVCGNDTDGLQAQCSANEGAATCTD
jgi:hypothetical protein